MHPIRKIELIKTMVIMRIFIVYLLSSFHASSNVNLKKHLKLFTIFSIGQRIWAYLSLCHKLYIYYHMLSSFISVADYLNYPTPSSKAEQSPDVNEQIGNKYAER